MIKKININNNDAFPEKKEIYKLQGIPANAVLPENVIKVLNDALGLYKENAEIKSKFITLDKDLFLNIYQGEAKNDKKTPVCDVTEKATSVALFGVTVGNALSNKISELFSNNEYALASMLDSTASAGADSAADYIEKEYVNYLNDKGLLKKNDKVLRYSPGYCGWHISGQKKIFEYLKPEDINIKLNDSFLMDPLKSITGVLLCGHKKIHMFKRNYNSCKSCKTKSCIDRIL